MENSPEHTEKIIQYLDGELTGSELVEFEKLMAVDGTISEELENLSLAKSAIQSYGLKQQVAGVHKEMRAELKGSTGGWPSSPRPFPAYGSRRPGAHKPADPQKCRR